MIRKTVLQLLYRVAALWGLCLLLSACEHRAAYPPEFSTLDAACDSIPQQVRERLSEMSVDMASAPENVRMKYALLQTKAADKAYILHRSDSVMKRVVAYFEKHGTLAEKMEACYYMGSVYRDLHDSPQAVTWYLKAVDYGEDNPGEADSAVLASVYAQLGEIFVNQKNYRENLAIAKKEYAMMSDAPMLADLASAYAKCSMNDSARICYDRLLRLCLKAEPNWDVQSMVGQALNFYLIETDEQAMADTCMRFLDKCRPDSLYSNAKVGKGRYHLKYGDRDSTAFYWKLVYDYPLDVYIRANASRNLFEYYDARGDRATARVYARSYMEAQDSIANMLEVGQTANVYNMYRYQRDLEAEGMQYRRAARIRIWSVCAAGCAIIFSLLLVIRSHRRKLRVARKNIELLRRMEQLEKAAADNRRMQVKVDRMDLLDVLKKFSGSEKAPLPENYSVWEKVTTVVEDAYPDFKAVLAAHADDLTDADIRLLYLLKMGLLKAEAARLMDVNRSTVTRQLKCLVDKIPELSELLSQP